MIKMILIQGSSRSWSGGGDLCMNPVDGKTVLEHTVERMRQFDTTLPICIIAPEFDRGGEIDQIVERRADPNLRVYYGHDASPLQRMIDTTTGLAPADHIVRIDGLNMFADIETLRHALHYLSGAQFDCIKYPDDYPVQFTADIYRVGALRDLSGLLGADASPYAVHPKHYMFSDSRFNCQHIHTTPTYSDTYMRKCRNIARQIYRIPRLDVNTKRISAGDQLTFHYELALNFLSKEMNVLDIACGTGYGTRLLAPNVRTVVGADIDPNTVERARSLSADHTNIEFMTGDVTSLDQPSNRFDAVISMETIEHVDDTAYITELHRVLVPGGLLIMSTPQNSYGAIPINAEHQREYSLDEITRLCSRYFTIEETIGIKQGKIIVDDDPVGNNTVLICRKR